MWRFVLVALVAGSGATGVTQAEPVVACIAAESLLQSRVKTTEHQFPADDEPSYDEVDDQKDAGRARRRKELPHLHVDHPHVKEEVPVVEFALYLNNMDQVNSRMNQCICDVIIKSRYRKSDFGNESISTELVNGKVEFRNEVRRWEEGDNVTVTEHLYVTLFFDGRYDLFPFDQQEIVVPVQLKGLTSEEARFEVWPTFSGIRPVDNATGYQFQTEQYYPKHWSVDVKDHHEFGMPYNKSRGELHIVIGRRLPFYIMTCSIIPSMAIVFAIFAFCLPITLIVPRVTISFTSFLAMFVHVKQMTMMVPDGVWCWLMTDLLFFCTILSAAITSNMLSAKLHANFKEGEAPLSEMHDGFIRTALPAEFLSGQMLICFPPLRAWHKVTGSICVLTVASFHALVLYRFYVHMKPDYKGRPLLGGMAVVFPCLFRATEEHGSKDPIFRWQVPEPHHPAANGHSHASKDRDQPLVHASHHMVAQHAAKDAAHDTHHAQTEHGAGGHGDAEDTGAADGGGDDGGGDGGGAD